MYWWDIFLIAVICIVAIAVGVGLYQLLHLRKLDQADKESWDQFYDEWHS